MQEIPIHFNHEEIEAQISEQWEKSRVFHAEIDKNKQPFSIVIPPPNVTGTLHLGHILDNVIQDAYLRWHRMRGFSAVWIPGTDHAGISTQNVVKKFLYKQGINPETLSREALLNKIWEFALNHKNIITTQLKKLGFSCDWERERFTLDEGLSLAVRTAFVRLFNKGLIYKGSRIVSWCSRCGTAFADEDLIHEKNSGLLWYIKYPFVDEQENIQDDGVVIATTRPETMLGDVAVAINPEDERYKTLKYTKCFLPLANRVIPIIKDNFVALDFGTGAVKITPAHDFTDYEVGKRHNLPIISIINKDGKIIEPAPAKYIGLDIMTARNVIVDDLVQQKFLVKIENYVNNITKCERCHNVIEPLISEQWFLKMRDLALRAKLTVEAKKIKIIPDSERNDFFHWVDNIRDWCISRQLVWGHQIPVYTCEKCDNLMAEIDTPQACSKCGHTKLRQETDVLDTWFSSALWPFSTLGWSKKTPELDFWFPTTTLFSGRDILFFWCTRMMVMALEFTDNIPFKTLVLHGLIRDEQGRKLSKSLGNYQDPLILFKEFGVDAVRATVISKYPLGRQDCKISNNDYKEGRALVTKLWNSCRFILTNLTAETKLVDFDKFKSSDNAIDKWIIAKLKQCVINHDNYLQAYNISQAFVELSAFFRGDFCDWFIEIIKPRLHSKNLVDKQQALMTAVYVMVQILKMFSLYIPYVTEKLWQLLQQTMDVKHEQFLLNTNWIEVDVPSANDICSAMLLNMNLVTKVREMRHLFGIEYKTKLNISIYSARDNLKKYQELEFVLNNTANAFITESLTSPKKQLAGYIPIALDVGFAYIKLDEGIVDIIEISKMLTKKIADNEKALLTCNKTLSNENYLQKAPANIVQEVKEKQKNLLANNATLRSYISIMEGNIIG
ncbi:MAG: valine--tRNA ligase [Deltaproteobacteria bacterium]|jgi:valyl-tRNA synthetase|nr:valine--tRNA ligase [Deltaproteobacteria bacterium]